MGSPDVTAADHILMAQAYEEQRRLLEANDQAQAPSLLENAKAQYLQASNMPNVTAGDRFMIAEFFVRQRDIQQAELFVSRYEESLSDSLVPSAGPVALRIQLQQIQHLPDRDDRISKLIDDYIAKAQSLGALAAPTQAALFVRIASLYELAGRSQSAVEWYRKSSNVDPKTLSQLVRALGEQNQKREAVELCRQAFDRDKDVELIYVLADVLMDGTPDDEAFAASNTLFQSAIQAFPKDAKLMLGFGNCLARQPDKVDEAIKVYQAGLDVDSGNVFLLNNLATVMADIPEHRAAALQFIDRAIAIQGNHPALLNTKATVLMLQNQDEQALQILTQIKNAETDARTWMVLAETHWHLYSKTQKDEHRLEAKHDLEFAINNGLETAILTPPELARLTRLKQELMPSQPESASVNRE